MLTPVVYLLCGAVLFSFFERRSIKKQLKAIQDIIDPKAGPWKEALTDRLMDLQTRVTKIEKRLDDQP